MTLFVWVCIQLGVSPSSVEKPKFIQVDEIQMATIACGNPFVPCQILPALYTGKGEIYVVTGPKYKEDRVLASYIVRALVYHIQHQKFKKKPELLRKYSDRLEWQADQVQKRYVISIDV